MMRYGTIRGCAKRRYDGIIPVSDTTVVFEETIICHLSRAHTVNGGGVGYLLISIMVKRYGAQHRKDSSTTGNSGDSKVEDLLQPDIPVEKYTKQR